MRCEEQRIFIAFFPPSIFRDRQSGSDSIRDLDRPARSYARRVTAAPRTGEQRRFTDTFRPRQQQCLGIRWPTITSESVAAAEALPKKFSKPSRYHAKN